MAESHPTARGGQQSQGPLVVLLVILLLLGLPFAVWLDLRDLSERMLRRQAGEIGRIIDDMRAFYASDVVGRVHGASTSPTPTHNYRERRRRHPDPGDAFDRARQAASPRATTRWNTASSRTCRSRGADRTTSTRSSGRRSQRCAQIQSRPVIEVTGSLFDRSIRIAGAGADGRRSASSCHNTHPDSPKHGLEGRRRARHPGDHRSPSRSAPTSSSFKYLLAYFVARAARSASRSSCCSAGRPRSSARMNRELHEANDFLAAISMKIAKYLSPQIYKSIFSGQKDVAIATERKKLTIFFSDIKDFTATTERLQPEELTALLNEYLTEMSNIALEHGATVDKFIGDAILVFFGDPETKGVAEDARACLRMAIDMQQRLARAECRMAPARHRAAVPRPHGHQHRLSATSAISAAKTAWTTRSSAPRRTSPRACSRSPSRAASCSATRPTRWCATSCAPGRCRRST